MKAYKFLAAGGISPIGKYPWPRPHGSFPGEWVEAVPAPCVSGVHACRVWQLPYWTSDELWRIELAGPVAELPSKVVAPRGRLLERVERWDAHTRRAYASACAERARTLAGAARLAARHAAAATQLVEFGARPGAVAEFAVRAANAAGGPAARAAERRWQAAWLREHLRLSDAG